MSDPKKLQVKVKAGDAARHGTDKAGAILPPLLAMGPVRRCYAILLLALCTAFGPLCTDMYLPALPDIAKDLNISTAFAQASISHTSTAPVTTAPFSHVSAVCARRKSSGEAVRT